MPDISGRSISAPSLFQAFPDALKAQLLASAIRKQVSDAQFLYSRGDPADGFWLIENGQVKIGHYSSSGDMQAIAILGPGDSFGELACIGQFPRVVDAQAIGRVEAHWITEAELNKAIIASPEINRDIMRIFARQLQEAMDNMVFARNMSASQRLAHQLLALGGGKSAPVKLQIRQQELAELIGVSRMTIVSALAELQRQGFIERHYRYLIIVDGQALQGWLDHQTNA